MSPAAILALISDLYQQVAQLRQENEQLSQAVAAQNGAEQPADAPGVPTASREKE